MKEIKIEWLQDSFDCECCGSNWAQGANVSLEGNRILSLTPRAHCFGGDDYSTEEVYKLILNNLGYKIEES